MDNLKLYKCDFKPMWPVGCCLVLIAYNQQEAEELARKTITHTKEIEVIEVKMDMPKVIEYLSGEY